jgi:hypothetical protein
MTISIVPLAAALMIALTGCEPFDSTLPERATVTLRIQGTLTAETDGTPLVGSVTLGRGGHFSLPVDLASTQTDALGRYSIEHTVTYDVGGCPFWLQARATGYETSSIEDSRFNFECIGQTQTVNITLERP